MRIIVLVAAFSSALTAQGPDPANDTPPRITVKAEPEYSEEARQVHLDGTVILKIIIDADGKPRDLQVVRSLGLGLDEKAIAAVSKWLFRPGTKNGQPVAGPAQIEVNFRLLDKDSNGATRWHLARAEFHLPQGVSRPICEKVVPPNVAADSDNASATLTSISVKRVLLSTFGSKKRRTRIGPTTQPRRSANGGLPPHLKTATRFPFLAPWTSSEATEPTGMGV